jgi:hypothetical protein
MLVSKTCQVEEEETQGECAMCNRQQERIILRILLRGKHCRNMMPCITGLQAFYQGTNRYFCKAQQRKWKSTKKPLAAVVSGEEFRTK